MAGLLATLRAQVLIFPHKLGVDKVGLYLALPLAKWAACFSGSPSHWGLTLGKDGMQCQVRTFSLEAANLGTTLCTLGSTSHTLSTPCPWCCPKLPLTK